MSGHTPGHQSQLPPSIASVTPLVRIDGERFHRELADELRDFTTNGAA